MNYEIYSIMEYGSCELVFDIADLFLPASHHDATILHHPGVLLATAWSQAPDH
jgi:hypothetical protein